ncbi:UNVERIFIED_CONTAM: hypothetical protein K2H54_004432 [Gekko kuhli]
MVIMALKQGKKMVCEYTEDFKRHATKVQWWPDGVLAEQYYLGLHPEIRETVLRSVHPVTLNAWMCEAVDAESWLQMIQIDNAATQPRGGASLMKTKISKPKEGVRETHLKQGLCLQCGEADHFVITCPGALPPPPVRKEAEKKHLDTL